MKKLLALRYNFHLRTFTVNYDIYDGQNRVNYDIYDGQNRVNNDIQYKLINGTYPFKKEDLNNTYQFQNINDKSEIIKGKLIRDDEKYVIEVEYNNPLISLIYTNTNNDIDKRIFTSSDGKYKLINGKFPFEKIYLGNTYIFQNIEDVSKIVGNLFILIRNIFTV